MPRRPTLLSVVSAVETRVGPSVEKAARSETVASALAVSLKLRSRTRRTLESASRSFLHSLNLPTASDVRRVNRRLAIMERALEELSHEGGRRRDAAND